MPSPFSSDLRNRVIRAYDAGEGSMRALGERFAVCERTVARWVSRVRKTGSAMPLPMGGARCAYVVDEEGGQFICATLDCLPDLTLPELCGLYEDARGVHVSPQTMSDTVRRLGYTRKRGSSAALRRLAPR